MRASILAIGTELTTGQITNRNAAWLSEQLGDLGVETVLHETVADDRAMIRSALDRCRALSSLIFVTGGLGPTTDDFTRDVIAEWLGQPLRFHEPSWKKINERLSRFGIPVAESNRQQAFYPQHAQVIPNDQGTADAFTVTREAGADGDACQLWVLPGPPREVASVWEAAIGAQVRARAPQVEPKTLLTWQCIGKSEAELGELTERTLAGSQLQTGYRAHRPYVEVKVWLTAEDMRTKKAYCDALDAALAPWVATRQGEDLAARLLDLIASRMAGDGTEIEIADSLSGGILAERLGAGLRDLARADLAARVTLATEWAAPPSPADWVAQCLDQADETSLTLSLAGFDPASGEWALGLRHGATRREETLRSPYRLHGELLDRAYRYAVEAALKRWCEWLQTAAH